MQYVGCMQDVIDYIEGNLAGDIETAGLAGMVHLSPFYFQRLFHRLVGSR